VAALKERGIESTDIPGEKGQFDVLRDGELVYSKHETGRFPEHDEVAELLS
jgi:selT/selW/selH-like putative selenoprotein